MDGGYFFCVQDLQFERSQSRSQMTDRIGLYWDCSKSRKNLNRDREMGILTAILQNLKTGMVDFYEVRNVVEFQQSFSVKNSQLVSFLNTLYLISSYWID